jgi:hypothetical protein
MKPNFTTPFRIAELNTTFNSVDFRILLFEKLDRRDCHRVDVVFRTPKGKYVQPLKASKEFVEVSTEEEFTHHIAGQAYEAFDKKHGWT